MIISTYKDEGPYYAPTRWSAEVSSTPDFIYQIRAAMEESADYVGVFDDAGVCKGIWCREADVEYGEGECYDVMYDVNQHYVLERDHNFSFLNALKRLTNK